jgi:hypothetical protein
MKNLFQINENEKQRILEMHQRASKNFYLINEQEEKKSTIPPKDPNRKPIYLASEMQASYPAGGDDPAAFINTLVTQLIGEITKNPEAKTMYDEGQMTVKEIVVIAGSSNNWGKKPTKWDTARNDQGQFFKKSNKGFTGDTDGSLYKANKDLANKRATKFLSKIKPLLVKKGLKFSDSVKETNLGYVMWTDGKLDGQHTLKYPGQFLKVSIVVGYSVDMNTFRTTITKPEDIQADFVLDGWYNCLGNNSLGQKAASDDTYLPMCAGVRKSLSATNPGKLAKYLGSFEIKWNPNVLNDPWTAPVVRWHFYWAYIGGQKAKITKVTKVNVSKTPKQFQPGGLFQEGEITLTDPELIYIMNLNGGLYDKYIKPGIVGF